MKPSYRIDDCYQIGSRSRVDSAERYLDPILSARIMYRNHGSNLPLAGAVVSVLRQLAHGTLTPVESGDGRVIYKFNPSEGYIGMDRVVFLVHLGGNIFEIKSDIQTVDMPDDHESQTVCPAATIRRKNINSPLTA